MVDRLKKYGVEIEQIFATTPPEPTVPQLIPCIVGPCFEVLESVSADGSVNDSARFMNSYQQQPIDILLTDLPAPRGNAATLDFVESEITCDLLVGGNFKRLSRTEAFLGSVNVATRAGLIWSKNTWSSLAALHLVIAFDQTVPGNATKDITVSITTAADEGIAEVISQINEAVGETVAFEISVSDEPCILLASTLYGAASSITIRKWGDNAALNLPALNIRIEASGFRVQDDDDRDTVSPWIEYFVGRYFEDADNGITDDMEPWAGTEGIEPCLLPVEASISATLVLSGHLTTIQAAKEWTGAGAALPLQAASPIRVGDIMVADGVIPGGAQIIKVELNRFKLGLVDSENSTYDSEGNAVNQVYKAYELGTMLSAAPFAPVNVYFRARSLTGSEVNAAATLTGSRPGSTPTAASLETDNTDIPTLVGQYLVFSVTEDGVEGDEEVLTWTGSYTTREDMADDFEALKEAQGVLSNVICTEDAGVLTFSTVKTGAGQSITIKSTGTANAILGIADDDTDTGADPELDASIGIITLVVPNSGAALDEFVLSIKDSDGVHMLTVADQVLDNTRSVQDLVVLLQDLSDSLITVTSNAAVDVTAGTIVITMASGWSRADVADNADWGSTAATILSYAEITGTTLVFTLDNNPHQYRVTFASNSMVDAVADINQAVGAEVASLSDDYKLVLTSQMKGICSEVEIVDSGAVSSSDIGDLSGNMGTAAAFTFGFSKTIAEPTSSDYDNLSDPGTGRPEAEFSVNTLVQTATVNGELIRESVTGTPIDTAGNSLYFSYRGLRKEVSTEVDEPDVIRVSNFTDLNSSFGPLDERNPLGLAMFYTLVSAGEGIEIKALGVSAVSPEEPEGTLLSYVACAEVLRSHEVYFVLPLSSSKEVIDIFDTHVTDMSKKENRGERVLVACPPNPERKPDTVILAGTGETTGVVNQFNLKDNPGEMLVANGVNPNSSIPVELSNTRQLYLEITVDSVVRRYSISRISGGVVTVRSSVAASSNLDGFFSEVMLSEDLSDLEFSLKLRGAKVTVLGTTKLDKLTYAETTRDLAQQYANRRQLRLYPDSVTANIAGNSKVLPSYYFAAALIGDACNAIGSTTYSGRPIPGFTGIVAPKLEETHYDIISAGNAVIEQPVRGGNLALRMQATTDMSSIEFREWSITKAVDQFAKIIRNTLKARTGPFNITKGYMDDTSLMLEAVAKVAVDSNLLKSAKLDELLQDPDEKTTVGATFVIEVLYPANYLKITILS